MPTLDQWKALVRDRTRVLTIIGTFAATRARRCFIEQRAPDGTPWPARYPNQSSDHLNIAGAIEDLKSGARIKQRRYENRPAGRDTGELMNRVTFNISGETLSVGSNVPYAEKFQNGGESRQEITRTIKRNLSEFLRGIRRKAKRTARRNGTLGPRGGAPHSLEELRLGVLFGKNEWFTESPARPFVGLSQRDDSDIADALALAAENTRL